jgi:hypothetical protein
MRFSVQLTQGANYTVVGLPPILASKAAKALLFDIRAGNNTECPDGYAVYDADGDWTERYRTVARH